MAEEFYSKRISSLKEWLDVDGGNFSDAEKEFLVGQYESLETLFCYEYADGWEVLLDSQYLPTLMIIVIVIIGFLVAGIFSNEFQFRADAIFFSTKLGRGRDIFAKIEAGFLTITAVYWGAMPVSAKSHSTAVAITIPFVLSCIQMFLGKISLLSRIMALFSDSCCGSV